MEVFSRASVWLIIFWTGVHICMKPESLAEVLKSRRKSVRINQQDLAQLAGVSVETIISLESGTANPTLAVLSKVLETLGLQIEITPAKPATSES